MKPLTMKGLEAGLDEIRQSPKQEGILELIVRRSQVNEREVLPEGELDLTQSLVGDRSAVQERKFSLPNQCTIATYSTSSTLRRRRCIMLMCNMKGHCIDLS